LRYEFGEQCRIATFGNHLALENGLIAINVPLDPLRLGAFSTRTTHPFYVARWNELLAALGVTGRIVNSFWNKALAE
jgi:hypothetical protein